jgi:hypothetical protein
MREKIFLLQNISKLLSSGVLTSIGFILLSSQTFKFVDSSIIIELLIILQLHSIGLTITKLNFDTISYALYLENPAIKPNIKNFILKKSLGLCLLISIYGVFRFNLSIGIILLTTILMDQYSNLVINQLIFRRYFNSGIILNLLSYPTFFLAVILSFYFYKRVNVEYCSLIFLSCICLKFIFSSITYKKMMLPEFELMPKLNMGFQQILNFTLFKADSILVTAPLILLTGIEIESNLVLEALFLMRFPELISGLTISLSVLYYPSFLFTNGKEMIELIVKNLKYIIIYIFFIAVVYYLYLFIWKSRSVLNFHNILFYLLNGVFVLFCNLITFNLIKRKDLKRLFQILIFSCLTGLSYLILSLYFFPSIILAVVPIQLISFVLYFFIIDIGVKKYV